MTIAAARNKRLEKEYCKLYATRYTEHVSVVANLAERGSLTSRMLWFDRRCCRLVSCTMRTLVHMERRRRDFGNGTFGCEK